MAYDNNTVAHMWAHQLKDSASGSNFYFEGNAIYSYGPHFRCGVIVYNLNGDKAYVLNTNSYSTTTSKHMCNTRNAIPNNALKMYTEGCVTPEIKNGVYSGYECAVCVILNKLLDAEKLMIKNLRAKRIDYRTDIFHSYFEIAQWINYWEMDKSKKWYKHQYDSVPVKMSPVDRLFTKRGALKSIKELCGSKQFSDDEILQCIEIWSVFRNLSANSSMADMDEAIDTYFKMHSVLKRLKIQEGEAAKRNAQRKKLLEKMKAEKAIRDAQDIKNDLEQLKKYHNGEINSWYPSRAFWEKFGWHTALRINYRKRQVVTSKGICLTYYEAERLWSIVKSFHDGQQFHHDLAIDLSGNKWAFNSYENDILTAGCHKIHYSECERIAALLSFSSK